MRRALALFLLLALAAASALILAELPGTARLSAGSLAIETSTPVLAFAALAAAALLYTLLRLLALLITLPARLAATRATRRRREGERAINRALVALAADHATDAVREAERARKLLADAPQALLLAAEAHQLAGNDSEAATRYETLAAHPETGFAGLRGLTDLALARQDWPAAAALADRAAALHPTAPWLRQTRERLAMRAGDWKAALSLAGPATNRASLHTAAANEAEDTDEGLKLARTAWKAQPSFAPAALAYATRLRETGSEKKAQSVLKDTWRAAPHPDLAAASLAGTTGGAARHEAARQFVAGTELNPETQLLLGTTALAAGKLEDARTAASQATELDQPRAWRLAAEVEDRIHPGSPAARAAWQRAANARPDPAWRCTACSASTPAWAPACANCGAHGTLKWQ